MFQRHIDSRGSEIFGFHHRVPEAVLQETLQHDPLGRYGELADALTKEMDTKWLCQVLSSGRWSISFNREIVKTKKLAARKRLSA